MELTKMVYTRFSESQYERLKELAAESGIVNLSTFIRVHLMNTLSLPSNGRNRANSVSSKPVNG